jgi:gamma-glutamyltranspeptidase/glutathione hydrolase
MKIRSVGQLVGRRYPCDLSRGAMRYDARFNVLASVFLIGQLACDAGCGATNSGAKAIEGSRSPSAASPAAPASAAEASASKLPVKAADDEATAVGRNGAVTSASLEATQVGLAVLQEGGNAVDAAIATAFALGVTHPSAGNIGGGGFMMIALPDGAVHAIDYREVAPGSSFANMYVDASGKVSTNSRLGPLAAGVPGDVAGLGLAHEKYGTLPWRRLIEPAIALARDGWILDSFHVEDITHAAKRMDEAGYLASGMYFRNHRGADYVAGDRWKQPRLAETLEAIAQGGWKAFYEGPLADRVLGEMHALGGLWTQADFSAYRAIEREPLRFPYHGHEIVAMPPPSAGGIVLRQILGASEAMELWQYPWLSVDRVHRYVEILRRTYADRNLLLGDPGFVDVPLAKLMDTTYLKGRLADISPDHATPSKDVGAGIEVKESHQTTHFSVVDRRGMAVANTFTLNGMFGAKVVLTKTGVLLNNEMDDFTAKPGSPNMFGLVQGTPNAIAPGKRMLSSMTPTFVFKDGKLRAVVGSPGGPTITTTVAQIIMQIVDYGYTIDQAVRGTRIHHQWLPDRILHESSLSEELAAALREKGHELAKWDAIGHANCIEIDPVSGGVRAIADESRDGGKALAY